MPEPVDYIERMREIARHDAVEDLPEVWDKPLLTAEGVAALAARRAEGIGLSSDDPLREGPLIAYVREFTVTLEHKILERTTDIETAAAQLVHEATRMCEQWSEEKSHSTSA